MVILNYIFRLHSAKRTTRKINWSRNHNLTQQAQLSNQTPTTPFQELPHLPMKNFHISSTYAPSYPSSS